jgi:hypothetical protein
MARPCRSQASQARQNITNRPAPDALYSIPQNFGYNSSAIQRQRTNGQLTLQFRPVKELTTTVDYTYSEQKIQTKRSELSAWFAQTPTSTSSWPSGHVVSPLTYQEVYPTPQDISVVGGDFATKTKNKSLGFNTVWKATPDLKVEFDAHHSTAESGADSPFGSENSLSNASFSRGTTKIDFTTELPVLSMPAANLDGSADPGGRFVVPQQLREVGGQAGPGQGQPQADGSVRPELRRQLHRHQQPFHLLQRAEQHLGRRHQGLGLSGQPVDGQPDVLVLQQAGRRQFA